MSIVVAIRGSESKKVVDGKRIKVIPFVGADDEGEFAQMGVGLIYPDGGKASLWGLVIPHMLIQSWRAMKILEQIGTVGNGTFCACYYAAGRKVHDSDARYLKELSRIMGDENKFNNLREEVLASAPSTEELNSMITNLRDKGVDVESWELEQEIKAGCIESTSLIETLFRESEEEKQAYKREDEEVKKPLPRDESLSVFFEELGIANFIIGGGFGGYGIDWGHIELKELDKTAKRDSFSEYLPDGCRLEHTTQGPETKLTRLSPGLTAMNTSFGKIEQPWFIASDGTKYTFTYVKFRDDHFFVKTTIEKKGVDPIKGDYPLKELRDMIGLPSSKKT